MILIFDIQFVEIAAPAPDADDEIGVILGVLLCIEKHLPIDGIKLKLMSAKVDKCLN